MTCVQKRLDWVLKIWYIHCRLNSESNLGVGLYDHFMRTRIFTLTMNKIFIWAPNIMRKVAIVCIWINWIANHLKLILHVSSLWEEWGSREELNTHLRLIYHNITQLFGWFCGTPYHARIILLPFQDDPFMESTHVVRYMVFNKQLYFIIVVLWQPPSLKKDCHLVG